MLRPDRDHRPSDAAAQAAAWAGLNANDTVAEWTRWVNDPDRSGAVLVVAIVLVTASLAAVTAQANVRTPPLRWRGSSTFFVGRALYLEVVGDGLAAPLVSLVAALVGWCVWKVRHDDIDPILFALADLGLALVYAALIPLVWSITTSPSATTSPAASATPAAHRDAFGAAASGVRDLGGAARPDGMGARTRCRRIAAGSVR